MIPAHQSFLFVFFPVPVPTCFILPPLHILLKYLIKTFFTPAANFLYFSCVQKIPLHILHFFQKLLKEFPLWNLCRKWAGKILSAFCLFPALSDSSWPSSLRIKSEDAWFLHRINSKKSGRVDECHLTLFPILFLLGCNSQWYINEFVPQLQFFFTWGP